MHTSLLGAWATCKHQYSFNLMPKRAKALCVGPYIPPHTSINTWGTSPRQMCGFAISSPVSGQMYCTNTSLSSTLIRTWGDRWPKAATGTVNGSQCCSRRVQDSLCYQRDAQQWGRRSWGAFSNLYFKYAVKSPALSGMIALTICQCLLKYLIFSGCIVITIHVKGMFSF